MDKTKAVIEFTNFRKSCEDREFKIKQEANSKIEAYQIEVQGFKTKFEKMQTTLESIQNNQKNLKFSHENEMADYVKEQNLKYKELLK